MSPCEFYLGQLASGNYLDGWYLETGDLGSYEVDDISHPD